MKPMQKLSVAVGAVAIMLLAAGCGNPGGPDPDDPSDKITLNYDGAIPTEVYESLRFTAVSNSGGQSRVTLYSNRAEVAAGTDSAAYESVITDENVQKSIYAIARLISDSQVAYTSRTVVHRARNTPGSGTATPVTGTVSRGEMAKWQITAYDKTGIRRLEVDLNGNAPTVDYFVNLPDTTKSYETTVEFPTNGEAVMDETVAIIDRAGKRTSFSLNPVVVIPLRKLKVIDKLDRTPMDGAKVYRRGQLLGTADANGELI